MLWPYPNQLTNIYLISSSCIWTDININNKGGKEEMKNEFLVGGGNGDMGPWPLVEVYSCAVSTVHIEHPFPFIF